MHVAFCVMSDWCFCLKAREYTRALTAVKLDKMFARPLVGALDGHGDGVFCSAASRKNLVQFISGTTCLLNIQQYSETRVCSYTFSPRTYSDFARTVPCEHTPVGEVTSCSDHRSHA